MREASAILAPMDKKARVKELKTLIKASEATIKVEMKAKAKLEAELARLAA